MSYIFQKCYIPTFKISETSTFWLPNRTLTYLGILPYLWLFTYGLISHVLFSGNLLSKLLVILYSRNCFYNVFLVIPYTITILVIVFLTTDLVLWQLLVTKTNSVTKINSIGSILWKSQENLTRSPYYISILFIMCTL